MIMVWPAQPVREFAGSTVVTEFEPRYSPLSCLHQEHYPWDPAWRWAGRERTELSARGSGVSADRGRAGLRE
jgi:hypothetical protein